MAPIGHPILTIAPPRSHHVYPREMEDHSLVSIGISIVVLSILSTGVAIYLVRLVWATHFQARLERTRSQQILSQKMIDTERAYKLDANGTRAAAGASPSTNLSRRARARAYSDDTWSSKMGGPETDFSDDNRRQPPARRNGSSRFRTSSNSLSMGSMTTANTYRPLAMHPVLEHDALTALSGAGHVADGAPATVLAKGCSRNEGSDGGVSEGTRDGQQKKTSATTRISPLTCHPVTPTVHDNLDSGNGVAVSPLVKAERQNHRRRQSVSVKNTGRVAAVEFV